jgi:hypothetical protein
MGGRGCHIRIPGTGEKLTSRLVMISCFLTQRPFLPASSFASTTRQPPRTDSGKQSIPGPRDTSRRYKLLLEVWRRPISSVGVPHPKPPRHPSTQSPTCLSTPSPLLSHRPPLPPRSLPPPARPPRLHPRPPRFWARTNQSSTVLRRATNRRSTLSPARGDSGIPQLRLPRRRMARARHPTRRHRCQTSPRWTNWSARTSRALMRSCRTRGEGRGC